MRIIKVDIPKSEVATDGVEDIKMDRLGQVVLITGKNGAGKTRILNKILGTYSQKPTPKQIKQNNTDLAQMIGRLPKFDVNISRLEQQLSNASTQDEKDQFQKNIDAQLASKADTLRNIQIYEKSISWSLIETSEAADKYQAIKFVPKILNLQDCHQQPKNQLVSLSNNINQVGVDNLPASVFAKIQVIQDRWFSATHQLSTLPETDKSEAISNYEKLKEIIRIFLNSDIGRTIDDEATLFGFSLGQSNLSDGQKILLQFCMAIYSQETALKDLILMMDEPENHLHPSVIIETIERIQRCVSNGQIWIATHSIPLLAHFDPSSIWYVENNRITHAGKTPEKVLGSLLGDESQIIKLQDFISLPAQFASSRYAFECLFEPQTVSTSSTDPQSLQIRSDLLQLAYQGEGKVRILDYGVGKGRLISNMVDLDLNHKEGVINQIDYIAFDKFPADKEHCESALTKAYGSSDKRYFNASNDLLSHYDRGSFHVVIMCNVLHEIDPKEWLNLFKPDGEISTLLHEDGYLLLVEDQHVPTGEKAYQKGFLVLDTPHLKQLFKITEQDHDFDFADQRGDGRLKAHRIPKRCLTKIDEHSRKAAIKSFSDTAKGKILEIRTGEQTYQNGKLHGFWTQQFANAQLVLSEYSIEL